MPTKKNATTAAPARRRTAGSAEKRQAAARSTVQAAAQASRNPRAVDVEEPPAEAPPKPAAASQARGRGAAAKPTRAAAEPDTAGQVLRQFRLVFNAVKTHFQQVEKQAGVGGAQVWALSAVRDRPGIGVSELARAMDIHQSTASNLVRLLVERGLVRVERTAEDRRTVQLHLAAAGARVLRRAPAPFTGVLPQALAALDARTLARLKDDLDALLAALQPDRRGAKKLMADL